MGLSYEDGIKAVYRGLVLLAVVTLIEVAISLFGKGHFGGGVEKMTIVAVICGLLIVILSVYKAYFIIYEFMHLKYEIKGMAMSILLPVLLLVWGIIAFFQEGDSWKDRRELINQKNEIAVESPFLEDQK